jgi:hypothetical protein
MSIIAESKGNGGNFTPMEAGTYVARCYSMVHIGTIEDSFQGEKKILNKVRLSFEFPTETKVFKEEEGERPYVLSKEFTLSMHEKASLRKMLEGWRGLKFTDEEAKSFDITKLLGKPCMIGVVHKTKDDGKVYAELSSIAGMPKGLTCPDQVNPRFEWSWSEPKKADFDALPDWLKDKMKRSKEYAAWVAIPNAITPPDNKIAIDDDGLPF